MGRADHRLLSSNKETAQQIALRYGHLQCADYLTCVGEWVGVVQDQLHQMNAHAPEGRAVLGEAVQSTRDILSDTDMLAGRWSRDDKVGKLL